MCSILKLFTIELLNPQDGLLCTAFFQVYLRSPFSQNFGLHEILILVYPLWEKTRLERVIKASKKKYKQYDKCEETRKHIRHQWKRRTA